MSTTEPEPTAPVADAAPPVTGHPAIDAALAGLVLDEDVHTHHDELARVLDVVQAALNPAQRPPVPRP